MKEQVVKNKEIIIPYQKLNFVKHNFSFIAFV